jgi:heparinase II/III-like protein
VDRPAIFDTVRSFDHQGLDDAELERRTLELLSGDYPDADAVHAHFIDRAPPIQLPSPIGPHGKPLPAEELEQAGNCLANTFEFYGERHPVGGDIDWDYNPGTDHWVHDLNRFAYLDILVRASRTTGDDKYAGKAAALVLDWVDKNPVTRSWFWTLDSMRDTTNGAWRSYLNIAIHCQRWAVHFDTLVPFWTPPELLRVLKSLHDQLGYLEQVIPTMTNNWIVIGANGMLGTTARVPELRDRQIFIDYAWEKASAEAARQVLPDGMQFELTQGYHMCVLRLLLNMTEVSRAAGIPVPDNIDAVTAKMLDYTMHTITPDGRTVAFNDSDPGSGAAYRDVLAEQGRLRDRADWLYVGTGGKEGTPPAELSKAFEYGGVYAMRTGWDADATYLALDGGPWGYSHQHDDRLSFILSALGRPFIIDPGRYLYDDHNPYSRQNYLNTTRAHSTIGVDGENQADRWFKDTWEPREKIADNTWIVDDDFQRIAGSHTLGYGEGGKIRVAHRRSVTFWPGTCTGSPCCDSRTGSVRVPGTGVFLILDQLTGDNDHDIHSRLQFFPGDVIEDNGLWHTTYDDVNLAVLPLMESDFDVHVEKGQLDPETSGWHSERVNHIEPSPTLIVHARAPLPLRGAFLMVPYRGSDAPDLSLSIDGDTVRVIVAGIERTVSFGEAIR